MKKILVFALITLWTAPLVCITHTNKTFFKPRPQNYYLPLKTSTWSRALSNNISKKYRVGLQATGYYRISTSKSELGAYFGASGSNTIIFDVATKKEDVDSRAIIHRAVPIDEPDNATDLRAILTLRPEHEAYGANFTLHQDFGSILHGLYLTLEVPLTNVCHNLNARLEKDCSQNDSVLNVSALDYLQGRVTQPEGLNEQAALTHAKICGRMCKTDIADINLKLGWLVADHCLCRAGMYGFVTIPTTPKTCGRFLFEPALGTCGHWALGVGFDSNINMYQGMRSAFEVSTRLLYRYLFKDHEVRTLGFKLDNKTTLPWSHYLLGGRIGQTGVFPLANVLTREVGVTPGMNAEAMINFSFHTGACTFDFGYDFYARECDKIQLPACPVDFLASFIVYIKSHLVLAEPYTSHLNKSLNLTDNIISSRVNTAEGDQPFRVFFPRFQGLER